MPAEQPADGYLFDLYRRYIGEPEERTDVYVGFGLFFGGIGIAVTALVLFLWGSTHEVHTLDSAYYDWIQSAYALGMLSLPAMMLGIVVLLPAERKVLYTSVVGAVITIGAVIGFVYAYPMHWNFVREVDYTIEVVATYALGLSGLIASTGAALVAHYLDLARQAETVHIDGEDDEEDELSDADVRRDIDEAMEDVELSWGGVQKTEHKRLNFSSDDFEDVSVDTDVGTKTARSSGVDAQVAGLKGLKGGETKTTTSSSTVDDQTSKLKELREQKRNEELATAENEGSAISGLLDRLRGLLTRR
ncbi:hypothetical protein SAMN04487967_0064 [Natronorubrum sediminis]|uniref:Cell division protein A N-terminal domain-containing protein n=1 Tax=Natronorubrum sediminis TaxID=640943 RepID=A0A1H6FKX4_9EURY|nr:permease [Natronorubrum sediminis]SEH10798.1 hypothetical protein SAMN04487967_0064 [Natronorubrum sediminis]